MTQGTILLRAYMAEYEGPRPKTDFAGSAGVSPVQLSHLLAGRRAATLSQAIAISDATAGAVPVRSWLEGDIAAASR